MKGKLRLLQVLWRERWDFGPKVVRTPGLGCQGWDLRGQSTWADLNENLELSPPHSLQQGNASHGVVVQIENKEDRDYNPQNSQYSCSEWSGRFLVSCLKFRIIPRLLRFLVRYQIINKESRMITWQATRAADEHP